MKRKGEKPVYFTKVNVKRLVARSAYGKVQGTDLVLRFPFLKAKTAKEYLERIKR